MSFFESILRLMRRDDSDPANPDETPLALKIGKVVLGIAGPFFCILFGLWNCVISFLTISMFCVVSGMLEMLIGFIVLALEFPKLVSCVEAMSDYSKKLDARPKWQKGAFYCIIAVPPVFLCFGLASFFGCGLVFALGSLYGMMALGKKASREDMAAAATSPTQMSNNDGQMPMGTDQHITLMEDPDVWRPT